MTEFINDKIHVVRRDPEVAFQCVDPTNLEVFYTVESFSEEFTEERFNEVFQTVDQYKAVVVIEFLEHFIAEADGMPMMQPAVYVMRLKVDDLKKIRDAAQSTNPPSDSGEGATI